MTNTTNKYRDNDGLWIGPRDNNGMPMYFSPITITATQSGTFLDCWHAHSQLFHPDADELIEAIGGLNEVTISVDANGENIKTWNGIDEDWDFENLHNEIHEAVLNA